MGVGEFEQVIIKDPVSNKESILLRKEANVWIGGHGNDGNVYLFSKNGREGNVGTHFFSTIRLMGQGGNIWLGGNGQDGDLVMYPASILAGNTDDVDKASIHLDSGAGGITLRDKQGKAAFILRSNWVDGSNNNWIVMDLGRKGEKGRPGFLGVIDENGSRSITLDGKSGDIILANADCAEEFDLSPESTKIESGTVLVISNDGKLQTSSKPYDKRVAGVVSGAGDFRPGIVLDKKISTNLRVPIALLGKVNCKVDADYSPINVGDMLTTSSTLGHAMKAINRSECFGAILGKALQAVKSGRDLIPILIALQ